MNFRQTLGCALFALLLSVSLQAQNSFQSYFSVQAGLGLIPTYFLDGAKTMVPPLSVSVNYRLNSILSVGAFSGFSASKMVHSYKDGSVHQWENNSMVYGVQFAAHSANFKKVDIYGGAKIGYSQPDVKHSVIVPGEDIISEPKVHRGMIYGGFLGLGVPVGKKIGFYSELGYGVTILDLGLTLKL